MVRTRAELKAWRLEKAAALKAADNGRTKEVHSNYWLMKVYELEKIECQGLSGIEQQAKDIMEEVLNQQIRKAK